MVEYVDELRFIELPWAEPAGVTIQTQFGVLALVHLSKIVVEPICEVDAVDEDVARFDIWRRVLATSGR